MTLDAIRSRLAAGAKLHMQLVDGQRVWWFEDPWEQIADGIAERLKAAGEIVELGDSLFGIAGNSQSWVIGGGVADRVRCLIPYCRRTKRASPDLITVDMGGYVAGDTVTADLEEEWICHEHWRAVPMATRRLLAAAKRKVKRVRTLTALLVLSRVWRRAKREAIEGAAGI
ncbi:hypothetical protein EN875_032395 [Mesorhizobium sp. M2D.F.Ca.ET.232.01.1.1]|uniref:hypothetical protein n=1 Tax=Mesorhizobium sp. M2D.F.Ca.ET.232.01.1.1 TaxID=2496670 RepID=UPI000FCC94B8|nr:hypothetical protein [Mesorhizobium sp. M2D.F.Ca.ET.232.01.1.1]TGP28257.1 hypothetical protein EN875_032395 [Mesorhizobium sp. M2D.F.Ca.ET.232.01.1.1]